MLKLISFVVFVPKNRRDFCERGCSQSGAGRISKGRCLQRIIGVGKEEIIQ